MDKSDNHADPETKFHRRRFRQSFPLTSLRSQRPVLLVSALLVIIYLITQVIPKLSRSSCSDASTTSTIASTFSPQRLPKSKYAYAAFLAAPENDSADDEDDVYFVGTRILAYQLLHDPVTRTNHSIPFLVLVTDEVSESKRARLAADGATIVPVEKISFEWIKASRERWRDVLAKLHLFEMTQYERIVFFDSDMFLAQPMDGMFSDPAAQLAYNRNMTDMVMEDEDPQPTSYVFAGVTGQGGYDHALPPRPGRAVNAGFILLQPSVQLYKHYLSVMAHEGRFDPRYPEQSLWNYVHRKDGNLPWAQLNPTWNANWATIKDYKFGVASLHSKWWNPGRDDELRDLLLKSRWMMQGSAEARDARARNGMS